MTRARHTLILARLDSGHVQLDGLPEEHCIFRRPSMQLPSPGRELARRYVRLTPAEVDLGFARWYGRSNIVHRVIKRLMTGDPLGLQDAEERRELVDGKNTVIGRLARNFSPPREMKCIDVRVGAIYVRRKKDEGAKFQERVRCDHWEVILPELVYEPQLTASVEHT